MKQFCARGEPQVWIAAAALAVTLLMAVTLIVVVMINGLGAFWPQRLATLDLNSGQAVLGHILKEEPLPYKEGTRLQLKTGNRDLYGLDFRWIERSKIKQIHYQDDVAVVERESYGDFYGLLTAVVLPQKTVQSGNLWQELERGREDADQVSDKVDKVTGQIEELNYALERRYKQIQKLKYEGVPETSAQRRNLKHEVDELQREFQVLVGKQHALESELHEYRAHFADINGRGVEIPLAEIMRYYKPNTMSLFERAGVYFGKLLELFYTNPRESNTEGGLFPAIFGTVLLIFVMSLFSFPLGVIAAIYLSEYAGNGPMVRMVRIAVNNLAGIPSIVYGIFGLGFFIYGLGGTIDQLFFPERLPTPTFGTGGLLWASLTLALLTVPVVIVTTEEALSAIPGGVREGSLALGSTRFQTLVRILIPMASPGIMTGLILSMARAAGEVAPLMITGVVKLAPALPLDGQFPFLHLDRKFMHLGFHIYDMGFQSPNVEAARPMVFVTTLLLVLIVLTMSGVAIRLRNKMKKKYTFGTF
ncbi:MAG: phosphate ABC transporter permease PstA [Desulfuromonadaceae bacterium]|nr:phosphate ABC transporter permease PstA [Desulfuromonadaceae bacterium]